MLKLRKVEMKPGWFIFLIDARCFYFVHIKAQKCKRKPNCTNLAEPIDNCVILLVLLRRAAYCQTTAAKVKHWLLSKLLPQDKLEYPTYSNLCYWWTKIEIEIKSQRWIKLFMHLKQVSVHVIPASKYYQPYFHFTEEKTQLPSALAGLKEPIQKPEGKNFKKEKEKKHWAHYGAFSYDTPELFLQDVHTTREMANHISSSSSSYRHNCIL